MSDKVPGTVELDWIPVSMFLPDKPGTYLIFAPSLDPESPLIVTCWYEPPSPDLPNGWKDGWGLNHHWAQAITHWASVPWPPDYRMEP